jgi:DNA-binding LytR/AlgR family response regulator
VVTEEVKISICDDNILELEKAQKAVEEFIVTKQADHQIIFVTFTNGNNMLSYINKHGDFDLLILDILMPGMNGIELAEEIRCKNNNCKIIFLSSSPEFAVNSYKVNAFYYLLKPFSNMELTSLMNKALNSMAEEKSNSIVIKGKSNLTRVQIHTILYVESVKHQLYFHMNNNEILSCYSSIKEFYDILLSDSRFIQCHRSFIVNMNYVKSISTKDFVLQDKTMIPISKQVYQHIKDTYINYFFNKGNVSI